MIVSSLDDRFEIVLDGVKFIFGPMSKRQKLDVIKVSKIENGETLNNLDMGIRALQYTLKDVEGIKKRNGEDFKLEFDNGKVSEASVDTLLNCTMSDTLVLAALEFIIGIPEKIRNVVMGEIQHVEVKYLGEVKDLKKNNP